MKKGGTITIVVAIIGALGLIISAMINRPVPPSPVPTPQPTSNTVPALHSSYSGTFAVQQTNTSAPQYISSLNESQDGSFMAYGSIGACTATYSGKVSADNTISFYGTEGA